MTKCYPNPIRFSSVQRSKVEAEFSFSGGATTGNGGISLPDMGTLVTVPNRKTDPSRTAHAILGLEIVLEVVTNNLSTPSWFMSGCVTGA